MLASPPSCTTPSVASLKDSLLLSTSQLKRKRSFSDAGSPVANRVRPEEPTTTTTSTTPTTTTAVRLNYHSQNAPVAPPSPASQTSACHSRTPSATSAPVASPRKLDVNKLRDTLEAQLSLEVLLKHNELRLIDQEIAKCQIGLEQLRRCSEIPYPASHVAGVSPSVSSGTGMVVCPPENGLAPTSPAPWGVTDGPYSRHYAKWLIPDTRFDGGQPDVGTSWAAAPTTNTVEGRSTRANPGDNGALASKARPQRGSVSGIKLQSLPNGYPPPKERAGPMIIRRKSDGVTVKLVCLDCRRDNFSSTQGFINHCRIAHNRNFASHDAAAVASGEPVEVDEAGMVVGGNKAETSNGPPAPPGYVHPLVRSAHVIESQSLAETENATPRKQIGHKHSSSMVETPKNRPVGPLHKRGTSDITSASLASPDTPHLSSLMQQTGAGVDLGRLVGEAKSKFDLGAYSSGGEEESEDDESAAPTNANAASDTRTARQPTRTVGTSQQPSLNTRKPRPLQSSAGRSCNSPCGQTPATEEQVDRMELDNLSPNTVESNQAPSLISDDDDGEAPSDSESIGPTSSDAGDDGDRDLSHINVEDDDDATTSADAAAEPKGQHPGLAPLSSALQRGQKKDRFTRTLNGDKEEKRVSFASPEKSPDTSPSKGKKTGHGK